MNYFVHLFIFCAILLLSASTLLAQAPNTTDVRLKEITHIEQASPTQLTGYGLVVGLDRTGDRARGQRGAPHTITSITNLLQRFGITVDPSFLTARNVAAVLVTATIDPFTSAGSSVDVTVSAIGDARSLSGGVLIQTPLISPTTGVVHIMAQGPVSTGAVLAASNGSSVQINHTNTGRIPNGAVVTQALTMDLTTSNSLNLVMKEPDFTNVSRVADAINATFPDAATIQHAGLISIDVPADAGGAPVLLAALEELTITMDIPARVVINERSGIIVAGGNVKINEVLLTYGSIVISTQTDPFVSQPAPFSEGETVQGASGSASIEEDGTRSVVLGPSADVSQLAASLNELGLTARDVIGIFQAIDRAGALQGDLIIL